MTASAQEASLQRSGSRRFDHIVLTSVFGDPLDGRTWSGAPRNLADALQRQGVTVDGVHARLTVTGKLQVAARNIVIGRGRPSRGEELLRSDLSRRRLAVQVAEAVARLGARHVLHTGAWDLPPADAGRGVRHYLYCDHTWALARRFHTDVAQYAPKALEAYERVEHLSFAGLEHIFTFGAYVRDNLIDYYRVPPDRVTAVGSGMGKIEPWFGAKDYTRPTLLFVAKHHFHAKGGLLVIEAFRSAQAQLPDLTLTIVGDERSRQYVPANPGIRFHSYLPWNELQQLYRGATLLTQPMLNDPWGQVYLEALASRTPVLGLDRHGLPEIVSGGRYGFLVDRDDPGLVADAIVRALADPARLARMASEGQQHVLATYTWDAVAARILFS